MTDNLDFEPISSPVTETLGAEAWLAKRGHFIFTIFTIPMAAHSFDISIAHNAPYLPSGDEHLARLGAADLFLDTLPFNGHTTSMDALWAGLPVLTCKGTSFAGRVAASVLSAAGLPELIAESLEAYEARARALAHDPSALADIRTRLIRGRTTLPLFDTRAFTRNLEAAYIVMWERQERGEAPCSFAVERAMAPAPS